MQDFHKFSIWEQFRSLWYFPKYRNTNFAISHFLHESFLLLFCTSAYMALPFGPCIFAFVGGMVSTKCSSTSKKELSQLKGLLPLWGFCSIVHFGVNCVTTSRWNSDNCGHVSICIMNRTCSLRTFMSIKCKQDFLHFSADFLSWKNKPDFLYWSCLQLPFYDCDHWHGQASTYDTMHKVHFFMLCRLCYVSISMFCISVSPFLNIFYISLTITFMLGLIVPQGSVFLVTRNRFSWELMHQCHYRLYCLYWHSSSMVITKTEIPERVLYFCTYITVYNKV